MLVRIELFKLFSRGRTYIGFGVIVVIVVVLQMALYAEGQQLIDFVISNLADVFYLQGNLLNAYLVSYFILNALWVHVPILVVLVTGDLVSGESQSGTLRLVLSRPVSRSGLITAKMVTAMIYACMLVLLLAILSMIPGMVLFGKGDLMIIMGVVNIIPEHDVIWRFIGAYGFGMISMVMIATFAVFLSSLSSNSLAPILTTMAVIIVLTLITSLNLTMMQPIKPYLFPTYLNSWQLFFKYEPAMSKIMTHGLILIGHILLFYGLAVFLFNRKDILT